MLLGIFEYGREDEEMEPWVIALIGMLCYALVSSFIAIILIGIDSSWRYDNYLSVFFMLPLTPFIWPMFVFGKKKKPEEKEKESV